MTTILVDTQEMVMYSDSRLSGSGMALTDKIFKADDGTLIGFAGTITDCMKFVEWYLAGANKLYPPTFSDSKDIQALTLNDKGCFFWDADLSEYVIRDRYSAIGSGEDIAKTALFLGWDPEDAFQVVFELDCASGPPCIRKAYQKAKTTTKTRRRK